VKSAVLALIMCLGVTACVEEPATSTDDQQLTDQQQADVDQAPASQSKAEMQIHGDELRPLPPGGAKPNSCFIGSAPCVSGYNTCNFECCSGEIRSVQSACGDCIGRANSWCGSGTYYAWWTP
jgi:hypothetical protein